MPWGIDRIGQKAICIQDDSLWQTFCCVLPCWPLLDHIYTSVVLASICAKITCSRYQLDNAPWPLEIFRLLDQRQTDISELVEILDDVSHHKVPAR